MVSEDMRLTPPYSLLGNDSADIIYVPLVRPTEQFVIASIIVKMTEADTTYRILADWQYSSFGFDTTNASMWNAKDIFNIFSSLDRSVFGYTKFKITDGRIIGDSHLHRLISLIALLHQDLI